jgi:hypothetical protein
VSSQKELTVSDNPDSVSAIVLSLSLKYHSWKEKQLEIPYAMPERVMVGNSIIIILNLSVFFYVWNRMLCTKYIIDFSLENIFPIVLSGEVHSACTH